MIPSPGAGDRELLSGDVCVVTGGTDGIGKAIARGLAQRGAELVIVGRDSSKGELCKRELESSTGARVTYLRGELSDRRDIDALVAEISRRWPALRFLVHSAGIFSGRPTLTRDGIEMNLAVNYLSRFALTLGLLPALRRASESSRLSGVLLVSGAASSGRVHFDDVNLTRNFSTIRAVSQYCRANDLFTDELARRLAGESNPEKVIVSCLKFGPVKGTNIRHGFPWWMKLVVPLLLDPLIAQTPGQAADSALEILLGRARELPNGALFEKIVKLHRIQIARVAEVRHEAAQLWNLSERLLGSPSLNSMQLT
jgi:NAD(P)-dependent dehydrogenase (short-subunit alcohol dehydrogenase family)